MSAAEVQCKAAVRLFANTPWRLDSDIGQSHDTACLCPCPCPCPCLSVFFRVCVCLQTYSGICIIICTLAFASSFARQPPSPSARHSRSLASLTFLEPNRYHGARRTQHQVGKCRYWFAIDVDAVDLESIKSTILTRVSARAKSATCCANRKTAWPPEQRRD